MNDEALQEISQQRGISEDILRAARIGIADDTSDYPGWIEIPYPHRGGRWKSRYRNPNPGARPKYADVPGAKFHLYNPLLLGPGEEEVWFCEGEFDTLSLIDQGYNAVGIHGVSNVGEKDETHERGFKREWRLLFEDTLCIVMFDNDVEGWKAGRRLAAGLSGEMFDEWPDGVGDVNAWHQSDPAGLGLVLDRFSHRMRRSRGLE